MRPIQEAIVLLQLARDKLDTDAYQRDNADTDKRELEDIAEDIGAILVTLENIGA